MKKNGEVVKKAQLGTKASVAEIFRTILETDRFEACEIVNATRDFRVLLGLFQGLDQSGDPLPPGYTRDTGVTVVGADGILPGGHSAATVQPQIKVYATRVKCSAQVSLLDGSREHTVTWSDAVCTPQEIAQGLFLSEVIFTLTQSRTKVSLRSAIRKSRR